MQRTAGVDRVLVAATVPLASDIPSISQVDDDTVGGSLSDADTFADIPQTDSGIVCDTNQCLGVVGQERPGWCVVSHSYETSRLDQRF